MMEDLPSETLTLIQSFLSKTDILQLNLTSKYLYSTSLSQLYNHLELGYYSHLQQLQKGIKTSPSLKRTIRDCTKKLTLHSRQNGNNWRSCDLKGILGFESSIETIVFYGFEALSVNMIQQIAMLLPQLKQLSLDYCRLVYRPLSRFDTIMPSTQSTFSKLEQKTTQLEKVSFIWTDITANGIKLLSSFENITHLDLGSNRNRYSSINGQFVKSLYSQCPKLTHLTINLPEISDTILCETIASYGEQLEYLSIRCDSSQSLLAIATHAVNLQRLSLRMSPSKNQQQDISSILQQIVKNCKHLQSFKIFSNNIEGHVPEIIWACISDHRRGQEAIFTRNQIREKNPQIQETNPNISPPHRRSIWFYTVSEEALEQRYYYNRSISIKPENGNMQSLELTFEELSNARHQ